MAPQPDAFDDLKTSLRFIAAMLQEEDKGLERKELISRMNAHNVSQNQFYKTIKVLTEIGLIEETDTRSGNVRSVYTHLTPKGRQIAQLAYKIKQALI